jgi:hypothetical protein
MPWLQTCAAHQVAGAEVQTPANAQQVDDCDVVLAALNTAHVRTVNASLVRKGFLRLFFSNLSALIALPTAIKAGAPACDGEGRAIRHMVLVCGVKHHGIRYPKKGSNQTQMNAYED